jgi:Caenorhabditis protein of unknown function, DUF268
MSNTTSIRQSVKKIIKPFVVPVLFIGIDPRRLISLKNLLRYLSEYLRFQKLGGKITHRFPILFEYADQAGSASGHYFHQDLLVASFIHKANPARHIDIGSRIDGFVAHVASFRKIDVMDVRDLNSTGHSNISFVKADLMDKGSANENIADSISCLHAIEHFGLGRYGDPLDPAGHIKGFNNILKMLKADGTLYISFPIGKSNETHFNAHRVFHPHDIIAWPDQQNKIDLLRFDFVDDAGNLHQNVDLKSTDLNVKFGCGIYTFRKLQAS